MLTEGRVYLGHLGPIPLYVHWTFIFLIMMAFQWSPPTSARVKRGRPNAC